MPTLSARPLFPAVDLGASVPPALTLPVRTRAQLAERRLRSIRAVEEYVIFAELLRVHCLAKPSATENIRRWLAVQSEHTKIVWKQLWLQLFQANPAWFDRYWVIRVFEGYSTLPAGVQVFYVDDLRTSLGQFATPQLALQVSHALVEAIYDAPDLPIWWAEPMWERQQRLDQRGLMDWQRQQQMQFREYNQRYAVKVRRRIRREQEAQAEAKEAYRRWLIREGWQVDAQGTPYRHDPLLLFKLQGLIRKIAHW